jgi:hypothetical protein
LFMSGECAVGIFAYMTGDGREADRAEEQGA